MAQNELQAKITADISNLESNLKKAQKLQDDYGKSISRVQKDIAENIQISKQYERVIDQLNNELKDGVISQKQYQKQLERIQRDEKETSIETANLRKELARLKREQKDVSQAYPTLNKNTTNAGKSTRRTSAAAIEFGRVLGDLPFGIQGVANNLQQLAFVVGAGAGLQIGVAAVTSLLTVLAARGDKLSDVFAFLSGASNDLARAQRELAEASRDEVAESRAELETLRALLNVARDESKAKETRQRAIAKINDEYGDYLPNLNLENVNTQKVSQAVEKLNQSLIRQAQIRGAQNLIAKETEKILKAQTDDFIDQASAVDFLQAGISSLTGGNAVFTLLGEGAQTAADNIDKSTERIELFRKRLQELISEDLDVGGVFSTDGVEQQTIRPKIEPITDLEVQTALKPLIDLSENPINIKANLDGLTTVADLEKITAFQNKLNETQAIAQGVANGISSSLNVLSQGITNSLGDAENGIDRFLGTFVASALKVISAALSESIALAILGSNQGAVGTGALAPFTQPAFLASMVGSVVGAFAAIPKFANGGIVPGGNFNGDRVPALLNSGEMVLNASQQSSLFSALNGNLSSIQNNSNTSNEIIGEVVLRGQNQIIQLKRAENNNKRFSTR